ncbi:MAG: NAD-dependent epimerase [Pirellula sp.]
MKTVLVTGAAGFIGFHVAKLCLQKGRQVCGLDNLNDYYDVGLKMARVELLRSHPSFDFVKLDLKDRSAVAEFFRDRKFDNVIHLAAQAGVRYSIENPFVYLDSNVTGTLTILEGCRHSGVEHLVFASSSSVYGSNTAQPFSVHDPVDHPLSLYAATKKANEMMAHSYSHLYGLPTTGLRFFTVYGPWGRPDMALFKFTKSILEGTPIDVYNHGKMMRDFTYVDDIAEAIVRVADHVPTANPMWNSDRPDPSTSSAPFQLFNIGNQQPTDLLRFIQVLEQTLGVPAKMNLLPLQPGDVPSTAADVDSLIEAIQYSPSTPIEVGIERFVQWYREYYNK